MKRRVIGTAALIFVTAALASFATAYWTVRWMQPRLQQARFSAAFGEEPLDRPAAEIAVRYQLMALARQACETAKQLQVFPTDNYPLEVIYWSNIHRLEGGRELALAHGFAVPEEVERFRNHEPWPPYARLSELDCFGEN